MRFVCKVCVVTLLASFFLMSHNASAATTTYSLNDYDAVHFYPSLKIACRFTDTSGNQTDYPTNVDVCSNSTSSLGVNSVLNRFYSYNSYSVEKDDIVEFYVVVNSSSNLATVKNFQLGTVSAGSNLYYIMDINQIASDDFPYYSPNYQQSTYTAIYRFTFKVISTGSWNFGFITSDNYFVYNGIVGFQMKNLTVFRKKTTSQINDEQKQATEDAAANSNTQAQNNSSSTQTTNLIGAFQSFVTALTSLNATNCNVTLPFPSALGGNMQVNICQNKDYAGNIVSVFGSLTLIVFYIPFSLKILSMIYNEIRSFTNG